MTAVLVQSSALSRTQIARAYRGGPTTWKACEGGKVTAYKRKLGRELTHLSTGERTRLNEHRSH